MQMAGNWSKMSWTQTPTSKTKPHHTVLPSASISHILPAAPCKTLRGGPCVADSAAAASVAAAAAGGGAELQPAGTPGAAGESCAPPAVDSAWPPSCWRLTLPAWQHSPRSAVGKPTYSFVSCGPFLIFYFNPFAAPACKISGLKDARTLLHTAHYPVLWCIHFQCYHFDENWLKGLTFCSFIGRFQVTSVSEGVKPNQLQF